MIYKFIWGVITVMYAPFFKKISFPSHIGIPIFTKGLKRVTISQRVRIMPGLRIETHKNGTIFFKEDISIGQNFHITSGGELIIGGHTTILGNVFITNIDHDYQELETHILNQRMIIRETRIGENCFIGFGAAIQAGSILGNHCIVGTNSVVRGTFPDYCVIVGSPARIVKRYDADRMAWVRTNPDGSFLDLKE
ncbi:DapH/DapD/GlmU-related protein [Arcticibacter tournemirensis]